MSRQNGVLAAAGMRPRAIRAMLRPGDGSTTGTGRRVLAVDDLDRWSPELLHVLSEAVDQRRIQVVGTVRSSAVELLLSRFRPALVPVLVELPPWRPADLAHNIRGVLDAPLHPVAAATLVEFSGGNPLCLVELVEQGRLTGELQRRHGVWSGSQSLTVPPVTFARVWAGLAGQPTGVRDVVATLGTSGPLPLPVLRRVLPLSAVTEAEESGWVLSRPTASGIEVGLRRPLDGRVAAAGVSMLRLRELLTTLVEALSAEPLISPEVMAATAAACGRAGVRLTGDVMTAAASAALRQHRPELAVELTAGAAYGVAVEVRAAALAEQGRFGEAAVTLASRLVPRTRAEPSAVPGEAWVWSAAWPAALRRMAGNPDDDAPASTSDAGDQVPALCADAWDGRRLPEVAAVGRRLLDTDALNEPSRLLCIAATSWSCLQLGQVEEGLALVRRGPMRPAGHEQTTLECLLAFIAGLGYLLRGSTREATSMASGLCRDGVEQKWHLAFALGAFLHGRCAVVEALPKLARSRLSESAASLAQAAPLLERRPILQSLALAHQLSGRHFDPESGRAGKERPGVQAPRLLTELGHLAEAETLLLAGPRRHAVDLIHQVASRARVEGWPLVLLLALQLATRTDPTDTAVQELTAVADGFDFALASQYGKYAAAASAADRPALSAAADHYESLGMRWLAGEAAATATAGADRSQLGAVWAATAKRVLGRLQQEDELVLPDWWGTASARVAPLTPRELEIAEAVVQGETSAEIAERLSLSRRTVDNHLQHIYRKVGVSSRRDLDVAFGTVVPRKPGSGPTGR